jgi:hypothetical protein
MTQLPEELELKFRAETATVRDMSIKDLVTPLERIAMREGEARGEARGAARGEARGRALGEAQGIARAIQDSLELRFGPITPATSARIESVKDPEALRRLLRLALTESTLESFISKVD